MRTARCLIAFTCLLGAMHAQKQLVIPQNMARWCPGASTLVWRSTPFRCSLVYDTTHFTNHGVTGPITITSLSFRTLDGEATLGGESWPSVTITMSSSPLDYTVNNALFAAWTGGNAAVVFSGALTLGPSSGGAPATYNLNIPLTTPFTYDPTAGLDLNIDIDSPLPPSATTMGYFSCASNLTNGVARRLSTDVVGATSGTISGFTAACRLGFTGPGGYASIVPADVLNYGVPCGVAANSFYQYLPYGNPFDLQGKSLRLTPAGAGYLVTGGTVAPDLSFALGGPDLGDDVNVHFTLTNPFPFPGGSTADLTVSNGYIELVNNAAANGDPSPTVAEFLSQNPRLAVFWHDWHNGENTPTQPLSGLYIHEDLPSQKTYVTWREVGEWQQSSGVVPAVAGATVNTFQAVLDSATGEVEYRYGAMNGASGGYWTNLINGLVGWTRGGGAVDPGSRDLSAETPFLTVADVPGSTPLTYVTSGRPGLGTSIFFTANNVPAGTLLGASLLSFTQVSPGAPHPLLAPGCVVSLSPDSVFTLFILPLSSVTSGAFTIPYVPAFMGTTLYSQFVAAPPSLSNLLSSNGLLIRVGVL